MTGDEEARAEIARRNAIRAAEIAEPEFDWHAHAWSRVVRALRDGRNPTREDILSAAAADPSFSDDFGIYVGDLLRGKGKPTDPPRQEVKPTRGVKPRSWGIEGALEEYRRFLMGEAPEPGRLPSIDDLLDVVVASAGVPEHIRDYLQQLRDGQVKVTRGRRPRRNVQFTRDVILIETFQALLQELRRDPAWRALKPTIYDVFVEFERRRWGAKRAWGAMTTKRGSRRPWTSRMAEARYFEAKARLDARCAADGEGRSVSAGPNNAELGVGKVRTN